MFLALISRHWKTVLLSVLAIALVGFAYSRITAYGAESYAKGSSDTLAKVRAQTAVIDAANRKLETTVSTGLTAYAASQSVHETVRHTIEQKHADAALALPQPVGCSVSEDFLRERNAIRGAAGE